MGILILTQDVVCLMYLLTEIVFRVICLIRERTSETPGKKQCYLPWDVHLDSDRQMDNFILALLFH